MAPVPKNTKQHFTHPNHPLIHYSDDQDYLCDGCKTSGFGGRFRCHACDYNMHEYCADCPNELSSFVHSHHLALVVRKAQGGRRNDRICDVCRDSVDGLFYRCKDCDFDAHPLCTQLPMELRHVIDNKHTLKLQKVSFRSDCAVCKTDCSSLWVYGCDVCRVNVHLHCVLETCDSPTSTQWSDIPVPPPNPGRSSSSSRGIPSAPPPWSTAPPPFASGGFAGPFSSGFDGFGNFGYGSHNYGYGIPYGVPNYPFGYPFGPGFGSVPSPHYNLNHQQSPVWNAPPTSPSLSPSSGKFGKSMFSLVGRLTLGAMSSLIFGMPIGF